jgi:inhibitor of KinA sporulation pathway (predicted exonuclease)
LETLQATINKSETFETCLQEFESWLIATGCVKASTKTAQLRVAVITDGCWDIRKFISNEFSKLSRVVCFLV